MSDGEIVRITTGISSVNGYSATLDGPARAEWDAMSACERQDYLDAVTETTVSSAVDAWTYVEGEE